MLVRFVISSYTVRRTSRFILKLVEGLQVFYKHLFSKSFLAFALAMVLFFAGGESFLFFGTESVVSAVAADDDNDKDDDKDKDDDDVEGLGPGDFVYNNDNFSTTLDCSNVTNLQVWYHRDFISTDLSKGPNILVKGSDDSQCTITITKITGGANCGFSARIVSGKIQIDTLPINNAVNCEMMIDVIVPRNTQIIG